MTPTTKRRLLKTAAYSTFFGFAFLLMLYLTFPYQAVADIAVGEARKAGIGLTIGSMGPSLFGVKAKTIAVTLPRQEGAPEPQPIPIDEVRVRPTLLPPGVAYEARLFGGTIEGRVGTGKRPAVIIRAKGLDLARTNSKAAIGLDLAGSLDTDIDLLLDEDGTKIAGKIGLNGQGLLINGGTVAQYDLPKVDLGRLELNLKVDSGKAVVDFFKSQGADVEASLDGDVSLAQKPLLSALKLSLKFKPAEDFLKRNSFIQTGLNFAMTKDSKGFYTVNVNRVLGNPGFQPKR